MTVVADDQADGVPSSMTSTAQERQVADTVTGSAEHLMQKDAEEMERDILAEGDAEAVIYLGQSDVDDSASAVDDEIWRQFDLAEEYHAMGAIANREASWEEAQYYFEKALKILAQLDIEADSVLTPEAVKYADLLDHVVADYRITLRSLGTLVGDVSTSALVERFGDMAENIDRDSLVVLKEEAPEITYDIPITMNERVKKSMVYFQTVAREAFEKYLRRSTKYKPMMLKIIRQYGLPEDLIYLSLVESGYNPHAYSWARAMGLWQFIASTGRMYDLDRNWWMDERKDPIKSTHAACRFLKYLYEKFGSWELAMAAYNGGPGRVGRQIKKQQTRDFWELRLRRQTMDYVPLIMAATVLAKNPEKYGFTDIEYEPPLYWDEVEIDKCVELSVVADEIGCSLKKLKELNPELLRKYTPPNSKKYKLKIPVGSKDKFWAAYESMPSPKETSWVQHRIRRGETISTIAARYGVSQYAIMEANNLHRRSTIYAGKKLIVPVPLDHSYRGARKGHDYKAENGIYVVEGGDTLWDIARAFGTTVSALRRINYVERGSRIYVGQRLKIPSNATRYQDKNQKSSQKVFAGKGTPAPIAKSSESSGSSVSTYKVRPGDTLWDIARMFGTTTSSLRRLNNLGRSSRIYPNQSLRVKGEAPKYLVHKVRRGESLSRIASRYRTSIRRIMANNGITDPDRLRVGQVLKIYTN
jgi:membrane-bound lytic murein transglycosylase D